MNNIRYFAMCVALVVTVVAAAVGSAVAADPQEGQLIAVLESDAPKAEKAITCKRLAVYGTKNSIPSLAKLLPDKELTSWARIALEVIPGAEADKALRDAMGQLEGRVLVGVINSIGVRRDAAAVDGLAGRLKDTDAQVASAAAVALGHVGNAAATGTLEKSLAGVPDAVRSAVAEGLILCAEGLLAAGKADEAAKLYDKIRAADVPKQRVIEATRGAILARGAEGIPLLIEQLHSEDKRLMTIGLTTARQLPGSEVTKALVAELDKLPADRQALLIFALADRGDTAALPAMLKAATAGPKAVRIVAVDVLGRVGDVSCVPALLGVGLEADADLSQAAKTAIKGLPGADVDAALVARLSKAEGQTRRLLIELAGQRRIAAATKTLLEAADDSDGQIRFAALMALGSTVELDDLSVLIERVTNPQKTEDTEAAEQALKVACIRMPDGEACAAKLVGAISEASVSAKCSVLEILGAMGNKTALEALGTAAKDDSPELQNAASRLLGEWMTVDAAPVLLDLAKTAPQDKYKIRAMRGYIRLVRQFVIPDPERVEMCRAAMKTANRDAEKKLVLEVMARYPSLDMLKLALDATKVPSLKKDATGVSLAIAQKIGGKSVDVKKLLAQIGQDPVKVEIVKAEYGAGTKLKDVTGVLKRHVRDFPLIVLPKSSYNASFGGDPVPGTTKQLKIQYRINGKDGEASFPENATIILPMPE
jgi:HEAT repeat protein